MKTFENVSSLKDATLRAGQLVETKGYYKAGDGGGGRYLIQASASVDGYKDHALAGGTYAVLQYKGALRARLAGAVGDGAADDTLPIKAALLSAPVNLSIGSYRITDTLNLTGDMELYGEYATILKDFDGVGVKLTGGSSFNKLHDLSIEASSSQYATEYTESTAHGVLVEDNRSDLRDLVIRGHKGFGLKLDISAGNGNKAYWDNIKIQFNGKGGCGVYGSQDDNSVVRASIKSQLNFGYGFYADSLCTMRNWDLWLYSERNWEGYTDSGIVYGVDIQKCSSSVMWIYSEEHTANVYEILLGDLTTNNTVVSARGNLDFDSSLVGSNQWSSNGVFNTPTANESGTLTTRRTIATKYKSGGARSTADNEYVESTYLGASDFLFGSVRGEGSAVGKPSVGFVSGDKGTALRVSNGGVLNSFPNAPNKVVSVVEVPYETINSYGADIHYLCYSTLKSHSESHTVINTADAQLIGTLTVAASPNTNTTYSALHKIDFTVLDGTLSTTVVTADGASTSEVSLSLSGTYLVVTFTESLGAQVKFTGSLKFTALRY